MKTRLKNNKLANYDLLAELLQEENRQDFIFALLFLCSATFFFMINAYFHSILLIILWSLSLITGIAYLVNGIKNFKVYNSEIYKLVKYNPENIVWVYCQIIQVMPFGILIFKKHRVFIHDIQGNYQFFSLKSKKVDMLMYYFQSILPHTTFGYSTQKEQLYRANPLLLAK